MNTHIITHRRQEVEQEIVRLKSRLSEMEGELSDLSIAERVFERLSGASGNSPRAANEPKPTQVVSPSSNEAMTMRQLIEGALLHAKKQGRSGLKPSEIKDWIFTVYGVNKATTVVNTRTWRLWKEDGTLIKTDAGVYSLRTEEIPADEMTVEGPSAGESKPPSAEGREAGPGGGP
jgi:hypothetical protein